VFPEAIPARIEDGIVGRGFPIEVYNVLGAGDAFLSGFLRGWLKGEALETCASWANACGAFAVSRLLCSPESPTFTELQHFLTHGSKERALRKDETLNHIHWATTRRVESDRLFAFAIDHRRQLEEIADRVGASRDRIGDFKRLAVAATAKVANRAAGFGMLLDETYGRAAMADAAKHDFWIGRPMEVPGSRPLRFEFSQDAGSRLIEWPIGHTIKCLAFYHPDDAPDLKQEQAQKLRLLYDAARKVGRELLIEIIAGKHGRLDDTTVARALEELYARGIKPDWWKLEPQSSAEAWRAIGAVIQRHDPYCRGIVLLGLEAPEAELERAFATAAGHKHVKGFAVGRTLFNEAAEAWLAGNMNDAAAIEDMAGRFANLVAAWQRAQKRRAA
jgi:5-dehydro-2-deoxygluconokinase